MQIVIELASKAIPDAILCPPELEGEAGSWVEFRGLVRGIEQEKPISALEYEAYPEMARRVMQNLLEKLAGKYPCLGVRVMHRIGIIPAGDAAIYVGVASRHRQEGFALLSEFMDQLKQDAPIWKVRAIHPQ